MPLLIAFAAGGVVGAGVTITGSETIDRLIKYAAIGGVAYFVLKGKR